MRQSKALRRWGIAILILVVVLGTGVVLVRKWYNDNLKPVSASTQTVYFTVSSGLGIHQIATNLHNVHLIKSTQAFETYVRGNSLYNNLQAGTYSLSPSMSVQQIVKKLSTGDVAKNLITILPSKRIDEVEKVFLAAGYTQAQVDSAFNPTAYSGHPVLASLPAGATLEGYLYPDSFQKDSNTPAETIIRESLDEMQSHLTPDIVNGFTAQGLTAFQGITLASIVQQESDNPTYQPTIAQVFLLRIKQGMDLQSNVTANYAADLADKPRSVDIDSPYNTYLHSGLPPGPIGNMTSSALAAVAHPAASDYLYFVAGDDGKVYFSHTAAEHQDAIDKYCKTKC